MEIIVGVGVDLVSITRFQSMTQNHLTRLAQRILTLDEYVIFEKSKDQARTLAKYWSAKESVSKCFGTGIRGVVVWKNMQLNYTDLGQPQVKLFNELAAYNCKISISHDGSYVIAYTILTKVINS